MPTKTKPYDLVITDILMPKLNGLEMIKEIKSINNTQKFLITTAFNETSYLIEAIDLGVHSYLVKPIAFENLLEVLYGVGKFHAIASQC